MTSSYGSSSSYTTNSSSILTNSPLPHLGDLYRDAHRQHTPSIFIPSRASAKSGTIPSVSRTPDSIEEDEVPSSQLNDDLIPDVFTMDLDTSEHHLRTAQAQNHLVTKLNHALTQRSPIPRSHPRKHGTARHLSLAALSQSSPGAYGRGLEQGMGHLGRYHPAHFCGSYSSTSSDQMPDTGNMNLTLSPTPTLRAVRVEDDDVPALDLLQKRVRGPGSTNAL